MVKLAMKMAMILVMAIFITGCENTPVIIDGTTIQTLGSSFETIRAQSNEQQRKEFDNAVSTFIQTDNASIMNNREGFHGKTREQLTIEARELALAHIDKLEEKKRLQEEAKEKLQNFKVLNARFYEEDGYFSKEPVIELTLRNDTQHAVSRAYFKGTVISPERSVPWIDKDFNYSIRGGIEPGEEITLKLAPNQFSVWGTANVPVDAVFLVSVERLDDADGNPLYSASGLTEYEEEVLNELKEKYSIN